MLIQACQRCGPRATAVNVDPSQPTPLSDPQRYQHITLTRKHTVLILASVRGGNAVRRKFIQAFGYELKCADGQKDICEMFHRAADKIDNDDECMEVRQCPEMRETITKALVLPAAKPCPGVIVDH